MLDARTITDNPDNIKAHLTKRNMGPDVLASVDTLVALAERRTELVTERDNLRARRNALSKDIGAMYKSGRADEAAAAKAEVSAGTEKTKLLEDELNDLETEQRTLLLHIPNTLHESVPEGRNEADNEEIRSWGTPRTFDFEPLPHVEVGENLGILDFERAAKLCGARFAVLKGMGARLERALINFFLDLHTSEHGYTEVMTPYMVHPHIAEGTGQLPKFAGDMFKLADQLNGADAYLIPTAEVTVTNLHREEILEETEQIGRASCRERV